MRQETSRNRIVPQKPPDAAVIGRPGRSYNPPMTTEPSLADSVPAANRWTVSDADHAARRAGPVWGTLDDWRVVEIDGPDALSFFHGQSTADIAAMTGASWQLGGLCTAKGRLLAIYQAWRTDSGLALLMPAELAAGFARRLGMFVLRAKATVRDAGERWQARFVLGSGAAAVLAEEGLPAPAAPWQCGPVSGYAEARIARLPGGAQCAERFLVVERAGQPVAAMDAIARRVPRVGAGLWHWSQIDAAVPDIFAATQERFVPQAVNLEVLGGVSFRKGCYPGQEVVARSQYLGKLRRRLALVHAPAIGPTLDVFHDDEAGPKADPVGYLVQAASVAGPDGVGGWDALIECPTQVTETGVLRLGAPDAPPAALRPLPYPIFDPTA